MPRKAKVSLIVIISLAAMIASLPGFVSIKRVQTKIIARLEKKLPGLRVKAVDMSWLPLPHVSLSNARLICQNAELSIPAMVIYPSWKMVLMDKPRLGEIHLNNPRIRVLGPGGNKGGRWPLPFARIKVVIKNGSLDLAPSLVQGMTGETPFHLTAINSNILIHDNRIDLRLHSTTPFCNALDIKGNFLIPEKSFHFDVDIHQLKARKACPALFSGRIIPLASKVDIKARITGSGPQDFQASMTGRFPSFMVKTERGKVKFVGGRADFVLARSGPNLTLKINDLEIEDPGLNLQGNVTRETGPAPDIPLWRIDLKAPRQTDLAAVRERLLSLWGDHRLVRGICGIVLGGRARQASFQFAGPAADFRNIKAMTITADVEDAPIHVPKVDLDLQKTSGLITIKDGKLAGRNLSAALGKSTGRNCELLLGLTKGDQVFKLDLDLEADLAALPPILDRLVHHKAFRDELHRFTRVRGRATGHLSLGERLKDVRVSIGVSNVKGSADYARLPWPVEVTGGRLRIMPDKVDWQDVTAVIGPHRVNNSNGEVDLGNTVQLDIGPLDATLDASALLAALKGYPRISAEIAGALTSISGPLELQNATIKGPAAHPEKWHYNLPLRISGLTFNSPLLPGPVKVRSAAISVDRELVTLSGALVEFLDEPLTLSGEFKQSILANRPGRLKINGTVNKKIGTWVKSRGWVPEPYFPLLPCRLRDFQIAWDNGERYISGEIIAGESDAGEISARLAIDCLPHHVDIRYMDFNDNGVHGVLALDLPAALPKGLSFAWQGTLSGKALDALLETNALLTGKLNGLCRINLASGQGKSDIAGHLNVEGLNWPGGGPPILIKDLRLNGDDRRARIERLLLGLGQETADIKGELSANDGGLDIDLALTSDTMDWENLSRYLPGAMSEGRTDEEETIRNENGSGRNDFNLGGRVLFSVNKFSLPHRATGDNEEEKTASSAFTPLKGELLLQQRGSPELRISSAGLCGLNISGVWHADPGFKGDGLRIATADPLPFQEVMPCLGMGQGLIEGGFTLNADLKGRPGRWRSGTATLHSRDGCIRRMTLLSKVFSLVNITDLFSSGGLPNMVTEGLPYSEMDLETHIDDNKLILDKAVVRGHGLNLFGKGSMDLKTLEADFIIMIAPLKTIDAILAKVPLIGRIIGGENSTIVTIPVGVKGDIKNPRTSLLPPEAIGDAILNMVRDTLMLPFSILSPILPEPDKAAAPE